MENDAPQALKQWRWNLLVRGTWFAICIISQLPEDWKVVAILIMAVLFSFVIVIGIAMDPEMSRPHNYRNRFW